MSRPLCQQCNTAAEPRRNRSGLGPGDRTFLRQLPEMAGLPLPVLRSWWTEFGLNSTTWAFAARRWSMTTSPSCAHLMDRARLGGFEVLDMQPALIADYGGRRLKFRFSDDNHWNGTGLKSLPGGATVEGVSYPRSDPFTRNAVQCKMWWGSSIEVEPV